jgi:magnesium transporter
LHIHPLTLEDILQQDPREKLEFFTNLGYYFISFRAIESKATKERLQREAAASDDIWNLDEGSIGEANVYLTVFDDGICCV